MKYEKEQIVNEMFDEFWEMVREKSFAYFDETEHDMFTGKRVLIANKILILEEKDTSYKHYKKLNQIVVPKELDKNKEDFLRKKIKASIIKLTGYFVAKTSMNKSLNVSFLKYIAIDETRTLRALEIINDPLEKRKFFDTLLFKSRLEIDSTDNQEKFLNTIFKINELQQKDIPTLFRFFPQREKITHKDEDAFFDKKIDILFKYEKKDSVVRLLQKMYDDASFLEKVFIANFKNKTPEREDLLKDLKIDKDLLKTNNNVVERRNTSIMNLFKKNERFMTEEQRYLELEYEDVINSFEGEVNKEILKEIISRVKGDFSIEDRFGKQKISFGMHINNMGKIELNTIINTQNRRISEDEALSVDEGMKRTVAYLMHIDPLSAISSKMDKVNFDNDKIKELYLGFMKDIREEKILEKINSDDNVKKPRKIAKI